jgi:hypothetical protein
MTGRTADDGRLAGGRRRADGRGLRPLRLDGVQDAVVRRQWRHSHSPATD